MVLLVTKRNVTFIWTRSLLKGPESIYLVGKCCHQVHGCYTSFHKILVSYSFSKTTVTCGFIHLKRKKLRTTMKKTIPMVRAIKWNLCETALYCTVATQGLKRQDARKTGIQRPKSLQYGLGVWTSTYCRFLPIRVIRLQSSLLCDPAKAESYVQTESVCGEPFSIT